MRVPGDGLDIFIGGGGDDLTWLGLGVMRAYAQRYARETGRAVLYLPNARVGRALRRLRRGEGGASFNIVGHSWGAVDAFRLARGAERAGLVVDHLITLDPVAGPFRRVRGPWPAASWLNVVASPSAADASDRLTDRRPWARKPSDLPVQAAERNVVLDLNHWNVDAMMHLSGGRARLEGSRRGGAPDAG